MGGLDLELIGPTALPKASFFAEDPLREIWTRVEQISTSAAWKNAKPENEEGWGELCEAALPRLRQAVEFRRSAVGLPLRTRPLPLYYTALNLLGSVLIFREETLPKNHHGLGYKSGSSLLEDSASLRKGFFRQLATRDGAEYVKGSTISLRDCLFAVPEIFEYTPGSSAPDLLVLPFKVSVRTSGSVTLAFNEQFFSSSESPRDLLESGELDVPKEVGPGDTPYELFFSVEGGRGAEVRAGKLLQSFAWPSLAAGRPVWFLPRATTMWPREAYYFAALFILGSAVRYNPNELDRLSSGGDILGWRLEQFLRCADRYLPQLALSWFNGGLVMIQTV